MGSPKQKQSPNLSKVGSVPYSKESERSKKRRQNNKKDSKKRTKSKSSNVMSPKKTDSQYRIMVDDAVKEEDEEPEFHRTTTWKSDAHVRKAALKAAHGKSSFRYDEALPVKNSRMDELMGVLGDIEEK